MNSFLKTGFLFILCAFLLVGCSFDMSSLDSVVDAVTPINLSGEQETKTFYPSDGFSGTKLRFEKISFVGTGKAKITVVPSDETKVEATYPSDILDHGFRVYFREGEIEISVPKQTNFVAENFEITVYANIDEVDISGAIALDMNAASSPEIDLDIMGGADVYIYNISAAETKIEVAGAASIDLSGKTDFLEVEIAGAGTLDSKSLVCKNAEVKISGAGTADISVTDELLADIDGVGSLTYYGDPVLKNISGGLTDVEQASKEIYGG